MVSQNIPECPSCGCEDGLKIAGPDENLLALEHLDKDRAGTYRCDACRSLYIFEAIIPEWEPKAQCTHCQSHDTRLTTGVKANQRRYHLCCSCLKGFRTRVVLRE